MSYWHQLFNYKLGQYSPGESYIGLDYRNLFLDPIKAEATFIHETAHALISGSTEYGQATGKIFQLINKFKHFSLEEKTKIIAVLRGSQIFTQGA